MITFNIKQILVVTVSDHFAKGETFSQKDYYLTDVFIPFCKISKLTEIGQVLISCFYVTH